LAVLLAVFCEEESEIDDCVFGSIYLSICCGFCCDFCCADYDFCCDYDYDFYCDYDCASEL
jgi:hypothetical protein